MQVVQHIFISKLGVVGCHFTKLQIVFWQNRENQHYFDRTGKITFFQQFGKVSGNISYTYINLLSFSAKIVKTNRGHVPADVLFKFIGPGQIKISEMRGNQTCNFTNSNNYKFFITHYHNLYLYKYSVFLCRLKIM